MYYTEILLVFGTEFVNFPFFGYNRENFYRINI